LGEQNWASTHWSRKRMEKKDSLHTDSTCKGKIYKKSSIDHITWRTTRSQGYEQRPAITTIEVAITQKASSR
jgi:hypothetical protein